MCVPCRARVLHCPTCRRQLADNTSSLAAALIEKVHHKCQFWEFGCPKKDLLPFLKRHEEVCEDRTINCPGPNGCEEKVDELFALIVYNIISKVQVKEFHRHAVRNGCSVELKPRSKFNLSKGWMQWDGMSLKKGQEFNLREDLAWSFFHFLQCDNQFYFSAQYFAAEQLFLFYVMILGNSEAASNFKATVNIVGAHSKIRFEGPVISIDK